MKQTPATAQISPLPWTLHRKLPSPSNRYIYAADETPICECDCFHESLRATEAANAALIVLSVNNHTRLLEALRAVCAIESLNPAVESARNLLASLEQA